jgi:hypothetical protein
MITVLQGSISHYERTTDSSLYLLLSTCLYIQKLTTVNGFRAISCKAKVNLPLEKVKLSLCYYTPQRLIGGVEV